MPVRPGDRVVTALIFDCDGVLADTERRAFKQAIFATRDEDAALDIVQDAMLKLTEKYADKPSNELPMLFARILQNTIHDHFRRQKVRNTWTTLLSARNSSSSRARSSQLSKRLSGSFWRHCSTTCSRCSGMSGTNSDGRGTSIFGRST